MYMSYVLDLKERDRRGTENEDLTYILATDADVKFTPEDVSALMDLMTRDLKVGAVCGRTRPIGNGPVVWYQIFDYAVGHWFLKVANHVFGSVLCSPGCFSVYRATALRDVLKTYAGEIDSAMDFLTKDMGEDRWLCTLMVEEGWRLEYCAAAENSTYCPDNFDEFFKQRRRWGPSSLANQVLLINEQRKVRENNEHINFLFILYQIALLISTVIGPATVLLIVGGGLVYSYPSLNAEGVNITLLLIVLFFIVICLKTKQDTQLKVAKVLTFFFAVVMSVVIVGLVLKSVGDVGGYIRYYRSIATDSRYKANHTAYADLVIPSRHKLLLFSSATWYLFCTITFFFLTALMHGFELTALIHGIWYLLCLPSGYLLLTIYSAANLTDRSWGTREEKVVSSEQSNWLDTVNEYFRKFCWCCPLSRKQAEEDGIEGNQLLTPTDDEEAKQGEQCSSESASPKEEPPEDPDARDRSVLDDAVIATPRQIQAISVEEWLPPSHIVYAPKFIDNGYEDVNFLYGIQDMDLLHMGITSRGHRNKIMQHIKRLPPEDIEEEVPENVEEWLVKLGLQKYWTTFKENSYTTARDLTDVKLMNRDTMKLTFKIDKEGHLKKLMRAVQKLQYPTQAQKKLREARKCIEKVECREIDHDSEEYQLWDYLRKTCLLPEEAAFIKSEELKEKLGELRNTSLTVLVVVNILWLTFMLTVMNQGDKLAVFGTDFASVGFLFIYFLVLLAQVIAMLRHRFKTFVHMVARIPFKPGKFVRRWSFQDDVPLTGHLEAPIEGGSRPPESSSPVTEPVGSAEQVLSSASATAPLYAPTPDQAPASV